MDHIILAKSSTFSLHCIKFKNYVCFPFGLLCCLFKQIKTVAEVPKSKMANTKRYHLAQSRVSFDHMKIHPNAALLPSGCHDDNNVIIFPATSKPLFRNVKTSIKCNIKCENYRGITLLPTAYKYLQT
jgi:hypothetical protein